MSRTILLLVGVVLIFCFSIPAEAEEKIPEDAIRVRATAYYRANTRMEGGFFDMLGNLLEPKKHTLAMDKSRNYGDRFKFYGTETWFDDYVWTNKDCGDRIYIQDNGIERVDFLVETKEEADEFGVRYIWMVEVKE